MRMSLLKPLLGLLACGVVSQALPEGQLQPPCPEPPIHTNRRCPDFTPLTFHQCQSLYALYEHTCFTGLPRNCTTLGKAYFGPKCKPYWRWIG